MKTLLSILALSVFLFSSCSEKKSTQSEETPVTAESTEESKETPTETLKFKSKGIQTIYGAYEKLRDALVSTDFESAKTSATELYDALKTDESMVQQAGFAMSILNASEIEAARTAFSSLTAELESLFVGALESGEINKCFCPMALDNTGAYWYSTTKEINNPYFGDKMLKCGKITKTIK